MKIRYVEGDATKPIPHPIIIPHVVNDVGAWGAGFVLALSEKWPLAEHSYLLWSAAGYPAHLGQHLNLPPFQLGQVQFVDVTGPQQSIFVANMCAQTGLMSRRNQVPLVRPALANCMRKVREFALEHHAVIHAPRFGSGLAGGRWEDIEALIEKHWLSAGIPVTIYDFTR